MTRSNTHNGKTTATEGTGIRPIPCKVRGQSRWRIEIGSGWQSGKRKRQHFKTEAEAIAAATKAAKERAQLGKAWDVMTANEKVAVMTVLGEIEKANLTLEQVWRMARNVPNAPKACCTLETAVDEVLAAKRRSGRRAKHIDNMEWYLGKFIEGRAQTDISTIGEAEITEWFEQRNEAPRSQKQHMGLLAALFKHAWRRRYIAENPVDRIDKVHIDQQIPHMLSLRQCRRAMTACVFHQPEFLAWLTLTLFLGMRPESEADYITWGDIDLKRKRIVIGKSKTRTPRIIDLSFCPPALEWLQLAKDIGSRLPIPKMTRIRKLRRLRGHLKLKRWPQVVLRHTAASNLIAWHQDAGKVASFLGNSAGVLLRSYKALVFKEDAEKWLKILPTRRHKKKNAVVNQAKG